MDKTFQKFIRKHQIAIDCLASIKRDYEANNFQNQPWLDLAIRQLQIIVSKVENA